MELPLKAGVAANLKTLKAGKSRSQELNGTGNNQMDIKRFKVECIEMSAKSMFRRFSLFEDSNYSKNTQSRYLWKGQMRGREITLKYPSNYPRAPMKVFVSPGLRTHHKWRDGSLCYMKSHEWSPNYTPATVIGIVARFLDEFSKGLTE